MAIVKEGVIDDRTPPDADPPKPAGCCGCGCRSKQSADAAHDHAATRVAAAAQVPPKR